ncbi:Alpha/Beta hydrolase protein [Xylaria venustula]|nr:Alpha/Beta hydrolase protein [Xylaria venustula]
MASDNTYTVEPKAAHTHTVIFLHGRDSDCKEFANELFESEASEPVNQPRTLPDLFPNIRWVFPSAPVLQSKRFGCEISQWFDMWSVESPAELPELQHAGLHQSTKKIIDVIKEEKMLVPQEKIFLAGISQGFATVLAVFFTNPSTMFAGLIGLSSWLPAVLRANDHKMVEHTTNSDNLINHSPHLQEVVMNRSCTTPIFLSHSADDDVVPVENGRDLQDFLKSQGLRVEWREYEEGGHWVNEPQGIDDIASFIQKHS